MRSIFEAKPIKQDELRICANCKQHIDDHTPGADNPRILFCDPEFASPYFYPAFRQMSPLDLCEVLHGE